MVPTATPVCVDAKVPVDVCVLSCRRDHRYYYGLWQHTGHQHGLSIARFATEDHRDALSMLLSEAILMSVGHVVATDHVGGPCCHQGP